MMAPGFLLRIVTHCLLVLSLSIFSDAGHAAPHHDDDSRDAVILMYHRFGEDRWPSTNVRLEQFDAHLDYLAKNGFTVMALPDILQAFRSGTELPPKTVAITVDDAYRSVLLHAWPRLKSRGFPFTLFVSSEPVDQGLGGYLSWDEIRTLAAEGVTIGHHGHSHSSFLDLGPKKAVADIATASARFTAELGQVPNILAYPYGEYDAAIAAKVEELGFMAALAQYSGVASADGNAFEIPRFALNENYASPSRFQLITNARALPVTGLVPSDPRVRDNPPAIGFTVASHVHGLSAMSCFPSHLDEAARLIRPVEHRIEIRFDKPFPRGRSRINCTMPGPDGRWYWYGRPFFVVE
ncbi:MAG: chitin deacetylase [Alphaproteobacteria bacterium]|nr:MAG: chitin deacetylase [Alphaproteobacteria bacterium]